MSYIGSTPTTQSFIAGTDYFNGNGSTVNFTLSRSVNSVNDIEVIVNNVEQIPSGYSVSGTTLTFSAAPSAGTSNVYVRYLSTTLLSVIAGNVTPTAVSDQLNLSAGYFALPTGTTAQRPGSPAAGMTRYNTTISQFEVYQNGVWVTFSATYEVEYLVIAGGGSGGSTVVYDGGGGGGGYRSSVRGESSGGGAAAESPLLVAIGTAYTVTIGAGGSTSNGADSVFGTITSTGGGRGGPGTGNGSAGGSGGGGGFDNPSGTTGGSGVTGQGFRGGNGFAAGGNGAAGGGGGAGAVGGNGGNATGGNGGAGVTSSITGSAVQRAGGGGTYANSSSGTASGGGGAGANGPIAGTANTGGGGNGTGAGGSGVVILRYLGAQRGTGGTVTSSGGYTIHTFTSSGTYTA